MPHPDQRPTHYEQPTLSEEDSIQMRAEIDLAEQENQPIFPDLKLDIEDEGDLKEKIQLIAEAIYATFKFGEVRYDPYAGHMLCGPVTDKLIQYLNDKGITAERIERTYEIKGPDGQWHDSFGHVYAVIKSGQASLLIDPTYLQFVDANQRESLPPVLVIRYSSSEELRERFSSVPIRRSNMIVAFWLGFDAPEVLEEFKDCKFEIVSEERARIDDYD